MDYVHKTDEYIGYMDVVSPKGTINEDSRKGIFRLPKTRSPSSNPSPTLAAFCIVLALHPTKVPQQSGSMRRARCTAWRRTRR